MKFDLTQLDFTKEITEQLKKQHYEIVSSMIKEGTTDNNDKRDVVLFHGTSLFYLNSILLRGLSVHEETEISNFEGELKANENLVYLTNKWHYWYAYNASQKLREKEDNTIFSTPCYIECKIPASQLVIDEDFFHSTYIKNKIKSALKRHQPFLEISYEECLNQYATVAHLGNIERSQIISFTLLMNKEKFVKNFIQEKSQYIKDLKKWGKGKGKGELKLLDLFRLEDDPANLTFQLNDIPENHIITEFVPKTGDCSFSLRFNKFIPEKKS